VNVMRVGFVSLALIIMVFASAPGGLASPTRIAFVQSQQPRNQTQTPEGGLPPEKKKSISKFGPEDFFGAQGGEDSRRNGAGARQPRNTRPTPTPASAPPPRQPATSAKAPVTQPSVTPSQPSMATPSPTINAAAALDTGAPQSPLSQGNPSDKIASKWAAPILIGLALFVSGALIWTLTKLFEKIREGSSG
jgi:hypothetical protein